MTPRHALMPLAACLALAGPANAQWRIPATEAPKPDTPKTKRLIPEDPKKVFLFLDPVAADPTGSADLAAVLTRLARVKLNAVESVRLKTYLEMPGVPGVLQRFGDLEALDRVSLIAIKNLTGFDGLVRVGYAFDEHDSVELIMTCFDFRNGRVFRQRKLSGPIGADLFQTIERDLTEFATTVRRSYRVTLDIDATPKKSEVYIDGRLVGTTPLVHELKSGEYRVRVQKEGFRTYEKRYDLSDGDRLHLDATLYNPLAARFLNADPGFRLDSNELDVGYRYVFLDLDRPGIVSADFLVLSWMMRFLDWNVGVRWASSVGLEGETNLDTFLGEDEGVQRYDINLQQFLVVAKYALIEKYSFASLWIGGSSGLTLAMTSDAERDLTKWSYSGAIFGEFASRIFRGGNFSLEAEIDVGVAYLGQLPYTERTFSLFGAGPAEEKTRGMLGPMGSVSLRLVFWNDIF